MPARNVALLLLISLAVSHSAKVVKYTLFRNDACFGPPDQSVNYIVQDACQEIIAAQGRGGSASKVTCDATSFSLTSHGFFEDLNNPDPSNAGNPDCQTGANFPEFVRSTEGNNAMKIGECFDLFGGTYQKYECLDVVDCASSPCDANAACADDSTLGSTCTCNDNFEGDGKTCTECLAGQVSSGGAPCGAEGGSSGTGGGSDTGGVNVPGPNSSDAAARHPPLAFLASVVALFALVITAE